MSRTSCPAHTASGRAARPIRRCTHCAAPFGASDSIGCWTSIYESISIRSRILICAAFSTDEFTDGVVRRMIDKWLKAGVIEDGLLHHTTAGSPQGGVISPCLSNIYLHYVLDEWFATEAQPRLRGRCILVRYADDLVLAFEHFEDAKRVLAVLGKRLERYGLTLHPDKTRFVDFRANRPERPSHPDLDATSFDFLGFTHVWGKSRNGKNMVRQVTAKSRYARALAKVTELVPEQPASSDHRAACLSGGDDAGPLCLLRRRWQQSTGALVRPAGRADMEEVAFAERAPRECPVGPPHGAAETPSSAATADRSSLHHRERSSLVKNRMREICSSGSVRGGGGNVPTYFGHFSGAEAALADER